MSLIRRLIRGGEESRDGYWPAITIDEYLQLLANGGAGFPITTYSAGKQEEPGADFTGYARGIYKSNGPVFAVCAVRMLLFSEARLQFQQMRGGRPGDLFGTQELTILEQPEGPQSSKTTGDLLARAIQDVDLAGNSFTYRDGNILVRWHPDWVKIVAGSTTGRADDAIPVGYVYAPPDGEEVLAFPWEVAHFAPYPDPEARFRGMSWLTPIVREIMADQAATTHKLKFFENGATPNLVVQTGISTKANTDKFDLWVEKFKQGHEGGLNAFKTLFLADGADAKVVGATLEQATFEAVQAAGESRIAAAAGIPPVIVGFSEGLDSGTYSNYEQARRRLSDGTMRPLWRNFAGSMANIIRVPSGARLWYDDRDVAFLRDDEKDRASIQSTEASTVSTLITAGFEPDSVVAAVQNNDMSLLTHSGRYSVQLLPPGDGDEASGAGTGAGDPAQLDDGSGAAGRALDRGTRALLQLTAGDKE